MSSSKDCFTRSSNDCVDLCEKVNVCANYSKGTCFYPLSMSPFMCNDQLSITNVAVNRSIVSYQIKIQNCSGASFKILNAELDLFPHFLLVDPVTTREALVFVFDNIPDSPLLRCSEPSARILLIECDCGVLNSDYGAGFDDMSIELFASHAIVPPGECCLKIVVAIDEPLMDPLQTPKMLVVDRASICLHGLIMAGESCCKVNKNLVLPGDCALRTDRNTLPYIPMCRQKGTCPGVTLRNWWRLGENDPMAMAPNPSNDPTVDSVGGFFLPKNPITRIGTATYQDALLPPEYTCSTINILFNGARGYGRNGFQMSPTPSTPPSTNGVTTDFCLEAWVYVIADLSPTGLDDWEVIAIGDFFNDTNTGSGYRIGLEQAVSPAKWRFGFTGPGTVYILGPNVNIGAWTHLAIVVDSTQVQNVLCYVDGVVVAQQSVTITAPDMSTGDPRFRETVIGTGFILNGTNANAIIDEVRFSTFLPGTFSANCLFYNAP